MQNININEGVSYRIVKDGESNAIFRAIMTFDQEVYVEKIKLVETFMLSLISELKGKFHTISFNYDEYDDFIRLWFNFNEKVFDDDFLNDLCNIMGNITLNMRSDMNILNTTLNNGECPYYYLMAEYSNIDGVVEEKDDDFYHEFNERERTKFFGDCKKENIIVREMEDGPLNLKWFGTHGVVQGPYASAFLELFNGMFGDICKVVHVVNKYIDKNEFIIICENISSYMDDDEFERIVNERLELTIKIITHMKEV